MPVLTSSRMTAPCRGTSVFICRVRGCNQSDLIALMADERAKGQWRTCAQLTMKLNHARGGALMPVDMMQRLLGGGLVFELRGGGA